MKKLWLFPAAFLAVALAWSRPIQAQAIPTATGSGALQAGVTYSNANSDLVSKRIGGISGYATFDLWKNFGLEADVRFISLWTPEDFAEKSYLLAIRYSRRYGRYQPYVRAGGGLAQAVAQQAYVAQNLPGVPANYGAVTVGGGLDIRLGHHMNLRAIDFEQQFWPGFDPRGLSPKIVSVGVAYRFR